MLPLSPEQMRSSTGNSIESVEQPWMAQPDPPNVGSCRLASNVIDSSNGTSDSRSATAIFEIILAGMVRHI
jgi:hypothetical protein